MSVTSNPATLSGPVAALDNTLAHYHGELAALLARSTTASEGFDPGVDLPVLDERLRAFYSASALSWHSLPSLGGTALSLLDLRHNPGTRTTKTMASLLLVARAVAHLHRGGDPVTIVTPSSANKATALRDAVWRAIDSGLVERDQLSVVSVVPAAARDKVFASPLDADPDLHRRNPVLTVADPRRDAVKAVVAGYSRRASQVGGRRLWFTMSLANYRTADTVRAYFEQDFVPAGRRLHAHAVSSGFGLLGHAHGARSRGIDPSPYFLVQHLDTPDMVLDLYRDDFDRHGLPDYRYDTGLHVQHEDPHFPHAADSLDEVLETTFYTHAPTTSPVMKSLIRQHGGGGIVVSLHECLMRYPRIRALLADTDIDLPADSRELREWSLVMALTGVLNAEERGLLTGYEEVTVHASGSYSTTDYIPLRESASTSLATENDLDEHVAYASR